MVHTMGRSISTGSFLLSNIIVAVVSGTVAAVFMFGIVSQSLMWEEMIAVALIPAPYVAVAVGVLAAGIALVMRRLRAQRARWLSEGPWISSALLVCGSLLLLGPVGGFHHMVRFGVLGYAIVDCESPSEDLAIPFGHCSLRGSAVTLGVTIAAWISLVFLLSMLLRLRAARNAGLASEDDGG